jgi:hypothetical protein
LGFSTKIALIYYPDIDRVTSTHPYRSLEKGYTIPGMIGEVRIDLMYNSLHADDLVRVIKKNIERTTPIVKWAESYSPPAFTYWESIS